MSTAYYSLTKPVKDSLGWADYINSNLDTIDAAYATINAAKQDAGDNSALIPAALDSTGALVSSELDALYETSNLEYIHARARILLLYDVYLLKSYYTSSVGLIHDRAGLYLRYSINNGTSYSSVLNSLMWTTLGQSLSTVASWSPPLLLSAGTILYATFYGALPPPSGRSVVTMVCTNAVNEIVPSFSPGPTPGPTS